MVSVFVYGLNFKRILIAVAGTRVRILQTRRGMSSVFQLLTRKFGEQETGNAITGSGTRKTGDMRRTAINIELLG